jgi:hypothetical protein
LIISILIFQVNISLKPFSSDEFDILDEALDDFISQGSSTKACHQKLKNPKKGKEH